MKKKTFLIWSISVLFLLIGTIVFYGYYFIRINNTFQINFANVTRIVIYEGYYESENNEERGKILFEITSPDEIASLLANTRFYGHFTLKCECLGLCKCPGWPRMAFYIDDGLVCADFQNAKAICFRSYSNKSIILKHNEYLLTKKSHQWYADWFSAHGVELK